MPPTISVSMAVYNSAPYLQESVESILGQTFSDFEFLIIDDGSTDNSFEILQKYAAQDSRIRLTGRENRGISKTRNEMLFQAQGEFIAVIDADDISLNHRFARQVEFLRQNPEYVCVGSSVDWIDDRGRFVGHCSMPEDNDELQRLMLGGVSLLHHSSSMFRRIAALGVGGYDESLQTSLDLDLWLKLGEVGKLANLKETLILYRLHQNSVTNARQVQQSQDALTACQNAWKRRDVQGEFFRQPANHMHRSDFWLRCGWEGFMSGKREVARRCGLRAIAINPLYLENWRLLACALLKPTPQTD
ncbi:MAG: glycosyltransferase [Leptolyngbyaceae cyanobacterium HOT.MB2.61]|nr:glycosyltransferase [Leptolyngbyaceae cyanobacterium HOT.MB2.61]